MYLAKGYMNYWVPYNLALVKQLLKPIFKGEYILHQLTIFKAFAN